MKKLMMAVAIVCAAVAANAATCSWKSGQFYKPADATGGWTTGNANKLSSGVTGYLFELTAAQYTLLSTDFSQKTIYDGFTAGATAADSKLKIGTDTVAATKIQAQSMGAVNAPGSQSVSSAGDKLYAAIVYTYTDATYGNMYIANVAEFEYGGSGTPTVGNLNTAIGGSASTPSVTELGWQSVPEPTSGLLLLLGVGALALRRRRA